MKFKAYQENGQPQLMDPEPSDDFIKWISFSEDAFNIDPQEWKTITTTLNPPKSASFGYYYAVVFSRADEEVKTGVRQTAITGGSAVLVLLDVRTPDARREAQIAEFSTDRSWYEFLPTTFNVKVRNSGNVHVAPRGNIFISSTTDKQVALLDVNEGMGNILPDSNRIYSVKWEDGFPLRIEKRDGDRTVFDEDGQPISELQWDFSQAHKLRFGKYTAKLVMAYDDGTRDVPLEAEVSFWVMPWRVIGASAVILFFAFIGFKNTFLGFYRKIRTFGKA